MGYLEGVEAVIDKDFASSLIAREAGADLFVILTGVDRVYKNYGKPNEEPLKTIGVSEARKMLKDGQFPSGSMGPKIEAAIEYIAGGGKEVIITSAEKLRAALLGRSGTKIIEA
jgi:carbamate kinase